MSIVLEYGSTKVLRMPCEGCKNTSERDCILEILRELQTHPDVSEVVLPGHIDRIYSGNSLQSLKEMSKILLICEQFSLKLPKTERERIRRFLKLLPHEPRLVLLKLEELVRRMPNYSDFVKTALEQLRRVSAPSAHLRPHLLGGRVSLTPPEGELVDCYKTKDAEVRIYQLDTQYFYFLIPPELTLSAEELELLLKIRGELCNADLGIYPSKEKLRHLIENLLLQANLRGNAKVLEIILRHTYGLGTLELLLEDENVQDVYVDASDSFPVYLTHREYQECLTNLYLTQVDLEALVSKFRAFSGRPFSESHPILELEWSGARIIAVGRPLSPKGISLSIRRHKTTPWTLPQLVSAELLSPFIASLLSLAVDSHTSILIAGSRGAGKTSLLTALLLEMNPKHRILVIEDTPELPVEYLRRLGYKIQPLLIQSQHSPCEPDAEDALRAALRMGESVLVIGEVRGEEARILFEAMRVGTAGNSVLGTIHGSSSQDVLDRIVHDLGIPPSSFKSTDLIVCLAPLRGRGSTRRIRKLVELTEVRKYPELSLEPLVEYDPYSDEYSYSLQNSELLQKMSRVYRVNPEDLNRMLGLKTKVIETLVEISKKLRNPSILEANFVLQSNIFLSNRLLGCERAFQEWEKWLSNKLKHA